MTLQKVAVSRHPILRQPLFVWLIYSGPVCPSQSNHPTHTNKLPITDQASTYRTLSHHISISASLLQAWFPRPGMIYSSSISLSKSSPYHTTHTETYFVPNPSTIPGHTDPLHLGSPYHLHNYRSVSNPSLSVFCFCFLMGLNCFL